MKISYKCIIISLKYKNKYSYYSKFQGFIYQVQVGMKRSTKLHVLDKIGSLAFIWSDHSNLLRFHSSAKESGGNLLYIGSFSPVEETTFGYRLLIDI